MKKEAKTNFNINWSKEKQDVLTLDGKVVSTINRSLRAEIDIAGKAINLKANKGYCFQGVIPKNKGFTLLTKWGIIVSWAQKKSELLLEEI